MNEDQKFWIALITTIATTLGIKEYVVPAIVQWWKDKVLHKRKKKEDLATRVAKLEKDIDEYRSFKVRTETAFQTLLPVIREIMREHPTHIALFDQLKNIIFEEREPEVDTTPTDGENDN